MDCLHTTISIGLAAPFRALHLSDSHICRADARDGARKMALAQHRQAEFDAGVPAAASGFCAPNWPMPMKTTCPFCTRATSAILFHTPIWNTCATRWARAIALCAGNHEYSLYVGEAFEDEAYKMQSFALVQSFCGNDLRFASRVMHGVNFVALDNVYYDFTARQLEQLKAEVARGLPIVLMMHTPLYTQALCAHAMEELRQPCAYLVGAPEERLAAYPPDRRVQQQPTRDTLAMIDYIQSQPQIRAILAGHLHYNYEGPLPCGTMQYVTGGGFQNCAREITFV